MLKIESNGGVVDALMEGTVKVITADLMCAINSIYKKLDANGDGTAKVFREFLKLCVNDGSAFTSNGLPE